MMEAVKGKVELQRYPEYKYSGVEWLGDIPKHWNIEKAKYLWEEKADLAKTEKHTLLSVSQYTGIGINKEESRSDSLIGYKKVDKDDLVINIMLAWLGGLGLSPYSGVVSPSYAVYNLVYDADHKFLHYLYRTKTYLAEFARKSTGIVPSRWRMYTDDFGQVLTLLPPKEEQTAIANFLDWKTEQINEAIEIKQKQIELLKERRQILIHKAVTRGLNPDALLKPSGVDWIGDIPEHWEVKKLKYEANLISIKTSGAESELSYIGMENVETWTGNYVETEGEAEGAANVFQTGDILFGKLRPYLAKVYLAKDKGICSTEFLVFRTKENILNAYLKQFMISYGFISLINSSTYGAKMPRANSDFIGNQLIIIPPTSEQAEICEFINSINKKIDGITDTKKLEIEKLKEYKTTLINSAVTGKIRVNHD